MRGNTFRPIGGDRVAVMAGEDCHHEVSCFADEVAIDFPSVAPAVDRIRRAFLADEHPVTMSTAIQLSPREAVAGATLPLEVRRAGRVVQRPVRPLSRLRHGAAAPSAAGHHSGRHSRWRAVPVHCYAAPQSVDAHRTGRATDEMTTLRIDELTLRDSDSSIR
jgi:hypothetical protein